MSWFLKKKQGQTFQDKASLADSRPIVIGRGADVDVSFPDDLEMSGKHARLQIVDGAVHFKDLGSTNGTFLNEAPVEQGVLNPGDVLRCGSSFFMVESTQVATTGKTAPSDARAAAEGSGSPTHQHGAGAPGPHSGAAAGQAGRPAMATSLAATAVPQEVLNYDGFIAGSAAEVFERFELGSVIPLHPNPGERPQDFANRSITSESVNDCLNFLARALPPRLGVWWAIQCIREVQAERGPFDAQILDVAAQWVEKPSEGLRRSLMALAEKAETSTPAAWVGVGIFWTHGSMAPPEAPSVPPGPTLVGKALSGAVILASVASEPEKAPRKREAFVSLAIKMASGDALWKTA